MAVQTPFFGKRDNDAFGNRNNPVGAGNSQNSMMAGASRPAPIPAPATTAVDAGESGSKLTVGPNIKLKGVEITDCDTLVVEGTVEATMNSRVIQIAERGAFHGTAEIDIAEIHGVFDGSLTVREKLVIYGSGKVRGEIRYGKIVIEEGGQLSGQIAVLGDSPAAKPALLEPAKSQPAAPVADTDAAAKLAVPVTAARVL
ncbi:bactofilin family protein [Comamonas composti]|uniref:bactofilin family protein n=1 Tax=Comamonas composti TaxID=408558 RepID=UPI00040ABA0F|nr:polymer-forming cytoskeletal protein [Comamonas composti]